jgi:hypothetical protein
MRPAGDELLAVEVVGDPEVPAREGDEAVGRLCAD